MKIWRVQDGTCLFTWNFPTAVKRVEFSQDGTKLLCVTEQRMGHSGSVSVYAICDDGAEQSSQPMIEILTQESKATVAGWSYLDKYIIMGHENGAVSQWNWKVCPTFHLSLMVQSGEMIEKVPGGHKGHITDLQFSPDRTYFITASKDKFAKVSTRALFDLTA
jgi:translation initiation factor 3 subunit I